MILMILCVCNAFSDKKVKALLQDKQERTNVSEVYSACSGGEKPNCCQCLETLKDMVKTHNGTVVSGQHQIIKTKQGKVAYLCLCRGFNKTTVDQAIDELATEKPIADMKIEEVYNRCSGFDSGQCKKCYKDIRKAIRSRGDQIDIQVLQ